MTRHWQIGETEIYRVEELSGPLFDPVIFFPDYDAQIFSAFADQLKPNHMNDRGRMLSSIHTWVVKWHDKVVLIDTCVGNDKDRMPMHRWDHLDHPYLAQLAAINVRPEQVDYVLCTHLHVDHVGWNTKLQDGVWVPTFPNAKYITSQAELDYVQEERKQTSADDFAAVSDKAYDDSILPIIESGQFVLIDDVQTLLDSLLMLEPAFGHTPGSITVKLRSGEDQAIFTGDIMHHPIQVMLPDWNSTFCVLPEMARWTRRKVLDDCARSGCLLLPAHFNDPYAFCVGLTAEGYTLQPMPANVPNNF